MPLALICRAGCFRGQPLVASRSVGETCAAKAASSRCSSDAARYRRRFWTEEELAARRSREAFRRVPRSERALPSWRSLFCNRASEHSRRKAFRDRRPTKEKTRPNVRKGRAGITPEATSEEEPPASATRPDLRTA